MSVKCEVGPNTHTHALPFIKQTTHFEEPHISFYVIEYLVLCGEQKKKNRIQKKMFCCVLDSCKKKKKTKKLLKENKKKYDVP